MHSIQQKETKLVCYKYDSVIIPVLWLNHLDYSGMKTNNFAEEIKIEYTTNLGQIKLIYDVWFTLPHSIVFSDG